MSTTPTDGTNRAARYLTWQARAMVAAALLGFLSPWLPAIALTLYAVFLTYAAGALRLGYITTTPTAPQHITNG